MIDVHSFGWLGKWWYNLPSKRQGDTSYEEYSAWYSAGYLDNNVLVAVGEV